MSKQETTGIQEQIDKTIEYRRIVLFLSKLTGMNFGWLQKTTASVLVVLEHLTTKELSPFERVMRYEGEKGPAGPIGNYGFYFQPRNQTFEEMCQQLLELAKQYRTVKYPTHELLPPYPQSVPEYPSRKKEDPSCVILLANGTSITIHMSLLERLVRTRDPESNLSLLHQVIIQDISVLSNELQHDISNSQADLTQEAQQEPPLFSIGLRRKILSDPNNDDSLLTWSRDPEVFLAITMNEDPILERLDSVFAEFGHVPIYGLSALNQAIKVLTAQQQHADHPDADQPDADQQDVETQLSARVWVSPLKKSDEVVFPEEDSSLLELAKLLDIFEVDTKVEIPAPIMKWLLTNKSRFGGPIGIWTIAGLLTSGQATFFPSNVDDGNLQIALGLGGQDLLGHLRPLLQDIRDQTSLEQMSEDQIEQIKTFFRYWEENKFRKLLEEEISSTKKGFGTATALAQATGVRLRNVMENTFGILMPTLVGFLRSRMQISSLGRLEQTIAQQVKSIVFFTAGSKDASTAIGILDNQITGRFFAKDPLIFAEAMIRIISQRRDLATTALQKLDGVPQQQRAQLKEWLHTVQQDGIDKAKNFQINGEKRSAMDFLRSIGNDIRIRREVLAFSHAIIPVLLEMARDKDFKQMLAKEFKFLAKQKTIWLLIHAIQLATIANINDGDADGKILKEGTEELGHALQTIFKMTQAVKSEELRIVTNGKTN